MVTLGAVKAAERSLQASKRDVAVALAAFVLTLLLLGLDHNADRGLDPLGGVLAALATFPLVARSRSPLGVFAMTTAASAVLNGLGYPTGPPFGPTVALFYVATDERTRARIVETASVVFGLFAVHVGATAAGQGGFPTSSILFGVVVWGGAWVLGDQLQQRRRRRAELEDRIRRAERETERERRLAAAEERTRIARDLHDSAANAIKVILVKAGAARLLQQRDPAAARRALATIEEVARETIGEIDQLVHGLRENGSREEPPAVEPPTGLAALETLAERYRAGGLPIEIHVAGRPRPLSRGLDQAAYRILQESLTNAARHGAGPAEVAIGYGETELELTVTNPTARPADGVAGGHGILGMRERAGLLGGSLDAGRDGTSFRVSARLPYGGEEQS